jgi:CheY-like chemotaxis protein
MKILIADDDATSRLVLEATLKSLGHNVITTTSGDEAWDAFQHEHFPVLISDWLMPGMDGLELCRLIRQTERDTYTYIILLTVLEGKQQFLEAMEAGADDFITKPLDEELLAARLHVAERILGLRRHVNQLEGLLPICSYCKKIRDDRGQWEPLEIYISERSQAQFSHGLCQDCLRERYPEVYQRLLQKGEIK